MCAATVRAVVRAVLLLVALGFLCTDAWFRSNGSLSDLHQLANEAPQIPRQHNPEPGVLAMRKRRKGDAEALRHRNAVVLSQAKSAQHRDALRRHWEDAKPVIGRMQPHAGPTTGGTRVRVAGTNFAGGSLYKCKFGHEIVTAYFDKATGDIVCVSPPLGANSDAFYSPPVDALSEITVRDLNTVKDFWHSANMPVGDAAPPNLSPTRPNRNHLDVKFSIVIFYNHENKTHHAASHDRKFHYYLAGVSAPEILSISPTLGPSSGGTVVTVFALRAASFENYYCQFGDEKVAAVHQNAVSGATEYLICTAPRMQGVLRVVNVSVHIAGAASENTQHQLGASGNVPCVFEYYSVGPAEEETVRVEARQRQSVVSVTPKFVPLHKSSLIKIRVHPVAFAPTTADTRHGARRAWCRFSGVRTTEGYFDSRTSAFYCIAPPQVELTFPVVLEAAPVQFVQQTEQENTFRVSPPHHSAADMSVLYVTGNDRVAKDGAVGALSMHAAVREDAATETRRAGHRSTVAPFVAANSFYTKSREQQPTPQSSLWNPHLLGTAALKSSNSTVSHHNSESQHVRALEDAKELLSNLYSHIGRVGKASNGEGGSGSDVPPVDEADVNLSRVARKLRGMLANLSYWTQSERLHSKPYQQDRKHLGSHLAQQMLFATPPSVLSREMKENPVAADPLAAINEPALFSVTMSSLCNGIAELGSDISELGGVGAILSGLGSASRTLNSSQFSARVLSTVRDRLNCSKRLSATGRGHPPAERDRGTLLSGHLVSRYVTFSNSAVAIGVNRTTEMGSIHDGDHCSSPHPPSLISWRANFAPSSSDTICVFSAVRISPNYRRRNGQKAQLEQHRKQDTSWSAQHTWEPVSRIAPWTFEALAVSCHNHSGNMSVDLKSRLSQKFRRVGMVAHLTMPWPGRLLVRYQRSSSPQASPCVWHKDDIDGVSIANGDNILGQAVFSFQSRLCNSCYSEQIEILQRCPATGSNAGIEIGWREPVPMTHSRRTSIACLLVSSPAEDSLSVVSGIYFDAHNRLLKIRFEEHNIHVEPGSNLVVRLIALQAEIDDGIAGNDMCNSVSADDVVWAESSFVFCPWIDVDLDCSLSPSTQQSRLVWKLPNSMKGTPTTVCIFHSTPAQRSRLVLAAQLQLSAFSDTNHSLGISSLINGVISDSLIVRLEQTRSALGDSRSAKQCRVDVESHDRWPAGTLSQRTLATCGPSLQVQFSLHSHRADIEYPFRLSWRYVLSSQFTSSEFDLVCIWLVNSTGQFLRYGNGFVAHEYFLQGVPLSPWTFIHSFNLDQLSTPPGLNNRLVARYEPRTSQDSGGCQWSSPIWGAADISVLLHMDELGTWHGQAPLSAVVEVSLNNQQFHADTTLSRLIYFDPWRWKEPTYSPVDAALSIQPSLAFEQGGQTIRIYGVPFVPKHLGLCTFNSTAVVAMVQVGSSPFETSAGAQPSVFQPSRATCVLPPLPVGVYRVGLQLDDVVIDSFLATSSTTSESDSESDLAPYLLHVLPTCGVSSIGPRSVFCDGLVSVVVNCTLPLTTTINGALGSSSDSLPLLCMVVPNGLDREASGSSEATSHALHQHSMVQCRVPPTAPVGWTSVVLRIGGAELVSPGLGVIIMPRPVLFGVFPSRSSLTIPSELTSAVVFFDSPRPGAGPVSGGTLVTVAGLHIAGGSAYRCRFGDIQVAARFEHNDGVLMPLMASPAWRAATSAVNATPHFAFGQSGGGGGRHGVIRCSSPPAVGLRPGKVDFAISLNAGADFVACSTCTSSFEYVENATSRSSVFRNEVKPPFVSTNGGVVTVGDLLALYAKTHHLEYPSESSTDILQRLARAKCTFADATTSSAAKIQNSAVTVESVYDAPADTLRCLCPPRSVFASNVTVVNVSVLVPTLGRHATVSITIGQVTFFQPMPNVFTETNPTRITVGAAQHGYRYVQYSPSIGSRNGGSEIKIALESFTTLASMQCRFGDVLVAANLSVVDGRPVGTCMSPPAQFAIKDAVSRLFRDSIIFTVTITTAQRNSLTGTGTFAFYSRPVPLSVSPAFVPVSQHARLLIRGLNFSSHANFLVAFSTSTEIKDIQTGSANVAVVIGMMHSAGAIVVWSPELSPGAYSLGISANDGHSFVEVPGRVVVMHDDRIFVQSSDSSQIQLLYSGFNVRRDVHHHVVESVTVHAPLMFNGPRTMERRGTNESLFDWALRIDMDERDRTHNHIVVALSSIQISYSVRLPIVPSGNVDFTVQDTRTFNDDNGGSGWMFVATVRHPDERSGGNNFLDWEQVPTTGLSAAVLLWTLTRQSISVYLSRRPELTRSMIHNSKAGHEVSRGRLDVFDGTLKFQTPAPVAHHETTLQNSFSTLQFLSASFSNNSNMWGCYGALCAVVFDSRYDNALQHQRIIFRVVPEALMLVNQTLAFGWVGRWFAEQGISYDVAKALGLSRDRIVVSAMHPATGVVQLDILASSLPADPTPSDLVHTMQTYISDTTSPLFDGIVTWATDPLFSAGGRLVVEHGLLASVGRCSQPEYLTKQKCLSFGSCRCSGITDRETCISSKDAGNYPCSWTPFLSWDPQARNPIVFAHCTNPQFSSKEECEWDGFCSNRSFETKPECLDEGYCVPFSDILTRQECLQLNERTHSVSGHCVSSSSTTSTQLPGSYGSVSNCAQFTNKLGCDQSQDLLSQRCGICFDRAGQITEFSRQFRTKRTCESPANRDVDSLKGNWSCPQKAANPCFPRPGMKYPRGFDCSDFATKSLCERPQTRPPTPCLMYSSNLSRANNNGHCPQSQVRYNGDPSARWKPWIHHSGSEYYPDLRFPLTESSSIESHLQGPPCFWQSPASNTRNHAAAEPCAGPAGMWKVFDKPKVPENEVCHPLRQEACVWNDTGVAQEETTHWVSKYVWNPRNSWQTDPTMKGETAFSCPCHWRSKLWHLTKCNWQTCGPSAQSAGGVSVIEMPRLKGPDDWVSDYQAFVIVGGLEMWMTLDTAVATTWVVSRACFMQNCLEDRLFLGAFIPSIPPNFVVIDLFERGLLQLGSIFGLLGHTYVNLAGSHVIGCPIALGIIDLGQIVGPDGFNHTGSIGLGFWEDNLPNWITFMDPALSLLTFLKCGNIFYPIPGVPVPVPKTFQMWGLPWFFPGGLIFKFSFFFGDLGGCFFLKGSVNYLSSGPTRWVFAIPVAVKMLAPSWLFILSDVLVRGQSIHPCMLGVCKATIHTGQFSITGPLDPMLLLLEQVSVAKTCEGVETLPDITWVIMGSHYTMNRAQYVVESEAYGEKECLTAFTPEFQLIPGFDVYGFGDVWIHAFYTIFEVAPLKRVGFAVSDQRYYEKNGCVSGHGQGPASNAKSMAEGIVDWQQGQKDEDLQNRLDKYEKEIYWKRYQNWMADLSGMADNDETDKLCKELGPPYCKCGSGFRFKEGSCIDVKHRRELDRLKSPTAQKSLSAGFRTASAESAIPAVAAPRFDSDGTSAATRFWSNKGGSGFSRDDTSELALFGDSGLLGMLVEVESSTNAPPGPPSGVASPEIDPTALSRAHAEFEERKHAARERRAKFESEARLDRVNQGVEPAEQSQLRFKRVSASVSKQATEDGVSTQDSTMQTIQLSTQVVKSRLVLRELYRNASLILDSWAPHLNVSDEQLKGWWRGESDSFVRYQRAKAEEEYNANLRKARLLAHSFRVKSVLNKRLLRKVASQMTVDPESATDVFEKAMDNIEGPHSSDGTASSSPFEPHRSVNDEESQSRSADYDHKPAQQPISHSVASHQMHDISSRHAPKSSHTPRSSHNTATLLPADVVVRRNPHSGIWETVVVVDNDAHSPPPTAAFVDLGGDAQRSAHEDTSNKLSHLPKVYEVLEAVHSTYSSAHDLLP